MRKRRKVALEQGERAVGGSGEQQLFQPWLICSQLTVSHLEGLSLAELQWNHSDMARWDTS